ncbi:uncharacterized protein N7483_003058 [Penicillium malachiteum]|uniref:uncharacterized protein n=1 Tax=Penicillium malachiteum TaxID=1324776 RepID=UPI0025467359|nr:uncharacterized protein N7483_003058 [Penicillium malachiteum]KAJ5728550.1 hypothetical protein N7483_003058 [Penicillium malachiteum]
MATETLQHLSLEEKVSLLAGASYWRTVSLPQHNIRQIKCSDGPNGVRGESIHASTKATCFPCASCVGSTFNPDLVFQIGQTLGQECKVKNAGLLLAPTINLHRCPLGGRNFEAYSEDPTLSGILGAAFVNGVQSEGVSACPKHFLGNECETNRKTSNSVIDETTLRELYAFSFQVLLKNSSPWAIMTAYNKVNGTFMSEHEDLIQGLLRKELGFNGIVISDFEGVYSTASPITAGVALELPGPTRFRGEHLIKAVNEGRVSEAQIDSLAEDVITFAAKVGSDVKNTPERGITPEETPADLIRSVAAEGIVLLKNESSGLPISPVSSLKIGVFGSPASTPIIHGGGSASMTPTYCISPLEALQRKFSNADIKYHPGVPIFKKIPSAGLDLMTAPSLGKPGVDCYWYNGWEFNGELIYHEILETTRTLVIASRIQKLLPKHCNRMHFVLKPKSSGVHTFGVTASGRSIIRVNDQVILQHDGFTDVRVEYVMQPGDFEKRAAIQMEAGEEYQVVIDTFSTTASPPSPISALARECDVAIVFTANNKEYESESFDRQSMDLSPQQNDLISTVARNSRKSIIINQTGSPISMPWINDVDAILQCWYAGQEVGNALADLLSGDSNPSGKLPVTFPARIEDSPSFGNFPTDADLQIRYEEGLKMGYRARDLPPPLFAFGHGLSYTQFEVKNLHLNALSAHSKVDLNAMVTVTNIGLIPGHEVVQVYVDGVLKGFSKTFLNQGESKEVQVRLDKYAFSEWDVKIGAWAIQNRSYEVDIRRDANTVLDSITYTIEEYSTWNGV